MSHGYVAPDCYISHSSQVAEDRRGTCFSEGQPTLRSAGCALQAATSGPHWPVQTDLRDISLCRKRDKLHRRLDEYHVVKQLIPQLTIATHRESADLRVPLLFGKA
jgi:hypothetical protein